MNRFIIPLVLISLSTAVIVEWIPTGSLNLPTNFEGGKLPCSKQTVTFPESLESPVEIEANVSLSGLVLANEGEIFLDSVSIFFGPEHNETCTNDGYIKYLGYGEYAWNQADVWSSTKFNKATPDAERVPCYDDTVVFPVGNVFKCKLPKEMQTVRQLRIGSVVHNDIFSMMYNYEDYEYDNYILHNFYFDDYLNTVIVTDLKCNSTAGCACQDDVMKIDCSVKYCPVPTCVEPIRPIGSCCKICGGALVFNIDDSFIMASFRELVDKTVNSYVGLVFHIGRIADKVQLVVVEDGDYDGRSSEAVNEVNYLMEKHWVRGKEKAMLSGTPMYKYGLGGKLFVSMFFVVVFIMGSVYAYYYKLPDVRYPIMGRGWFNIGTRFQRRSDSVVSLTRRDSVASGFRNPLYDSKRERVLVTES